MILLTKLSGEQFVVNADVIETIETTPDTVITVSSGRKYVVQESVSEVLDRVSAHLSHAVLRKAMRRLQIVRRNQEPPAASPADT